MKRLILAAMMILFATTANAQKDVTKFLGIPVDGTKAEMIQKLKAKGFTSSAYDSEILQGEFNGEDVNIHIVTNNNRVYRVMVSDRNTKNETNIRIRFNNLCYQFEHNDNYIFFTEDQSIPQDEDISYEMSIKNKRYQAAYYQNPVMDSTTLANTVLENLSSKYNYTVEQVATLTEEEQAKLQFDLAYDLISKKSVWFMISERYGEYSILMYYDNEYNRSNGEDL
ncbi:MAG: hypothetical protein IKK27_04775 [Alistipes sp.]|nr:hypothetical protein [Alistipes sp.]